MDRFTNIYQNHAEQYDALVSFEDYEGNLLPAVQAICPLDGIDVVEFGAGTGRVTRLLAPHVKSIWAFDASQAMLDVAAERLAADGVTNWTVGTADNRTLPIPDNSADLTIEGWSFSMYFVTTPDSWQQSIRDAVLEMERITQPGGTAILIETLGTGNEQPRYTHDKMERLYYLAEHEWGFTRTWIRTDCRYESPQQAEELSRFFFGDEMGDKVRNHGWSIVPECTGILWKNIEK